jgi:predicted NBD/HSP70 family sugar kinase
MRKRRAVKRDVLADPMYNSKLVTKLINRIMLDGKKGTAQRILYSAFDMIKEKTGEEPVEVYEKAMEKKEPYYSTVKEASYEIGKALGNVLNVLNINSIFVCGDIISSRNVFFDNFNKGMEKMLINNANRII